MCISWRMTLGPGEFVDITWEVDFVECFEVFLRIRHPNSPPIRHVTRPKAIPTATATTTTRQTESALGWEVSWPHTVIASRHSRVTATDIRGRTVETVGAHPRVAANVLARSGQNRASHEV